MTGVFRAASIALLVGCLSAALAGPAGAAPRNVRPAATQPLPPVAPAPPLQDAAPAVPPVAAAGLCQCISERATLRVSCLSSPAACQSICATTHYSFVPDAQFSCRAAAREGTTQ